jgi:hypothetical protein
VNTSVLVSFLDIQARSPIKRLGTSHAIERSRLQSWFSVSGLSIIHICSDRPGQPGRRQAAGRVSPRPTRLPAGRRTGAPVGPRNGSSSSSTVTMSVPDPGSTTASSQHHLIRRSRPGDNCAPGAHSSNVHGYQHLPFLGRRGPTVT